MELSVLINIQNTLNFGAALHSYAFQQYLDKQGIDNVIIDYLPRFMKTYNMKYPFLSEQPKEKIKRFFFGLDISFRICTDTKIYELFVRSHA